MLQTEEYGVSELHASLAAFRVCSFDSNDCVMLFSENKYDDDEIVLVVACQFFRLLWPSAVSGPPIFEPDRFVKTLNVTADMKNHCLKCQYQL